MALWDRQIEFLQSIGIRFNPLEVLWLEDPPEGAQVLHLHPLWDPDTPEGQIGFMQDGNGEVVWKAEIITLLHPNETNRQHWGNRAVTTVLHEEMEHQFGSLSGIYPCYFGEVAGDTDDYESNLEYMRREDPHPYPFWTCIPLYSPLDLEGAKQVRQASTLRLRNSIYDDLFFVAEIEARSEWCITGSDVWLELNDPNWKLPQYDPRWGDQSELAWDEYEDPDAIREALADAYGRLIDAGYSADPRYTREQHISMGTVWVPFSVEPVEAFLDQPNAICQRGLAMWLSIRSRTEALRYTVISLAGEREKHTLEVLEGATQ